METVYAVIAKNASGSRYNIRLKYPDRDNGNGLWWPSDLYGDHYRTREQARGVVQDRGWIEVRNWRQARRNHAEQEKS